MQRCRCFMQQPLRRRISSSLQPAFQPIKSSHDHKGVYFITLLVQIGSKNHYLSLILVRGKKRLAKLWKVPSYGQIFHVLYTKRGIKNIKYSAKSVVCLYEYILDTHSMIALYRSERLLFKNRHVLQILETFYKQFYAKIRYGVFFWT